MSHYTLVTSSQGNTTRQDAHTQTSITGCSNNKSVSAIYSVITAQHYWQPCQCVYHTNKKWQRFVCSPLCLGATLSLSVFSVFWPAVQVLSIATTLSLWEPVSSFFNYFTMQELKPKAKLKLDKTPQHLILSLNRVGSSPYQWNTSGLWGLWLMQCECWLSMIQHIIIIIICVEQCWGIAFLTSVVTFVSIYQASNLTHCLKLNHLIHLINSNNLIHLINFTADPFISKPRFEIVYLAQK